MGMEKNFDKWNERKKGLHVSTFKDYVHAREVWWCALGVNIGVEADGKHDNFERPILIIRKFNKDSILVVPLTSRIKKNPYHIVYVHRGVQYAAIISQMRLISTNRLLRQIFSMDSNTFEGILSAVTDMIRKRPPLAREPRWPHGRK